eukprot:CAMPEP_0167784008 /NCGR_PEP_ID=MMETSP0111_2-20121227/7393_1 /TAXON_ID=91324 /ORGANISM="Lotharella globosa, Strain CCCM811" /LENGTH=189 /DNA_ID=CAMNT_0007675021 /DNA_START=1449 /DNA_END=2018 /DNA_ORIENTATION=+
MSLAEPSLAIETVSVGSLSRWTKPQPPMLPSSAAVTTVSGPSLRLLGLFRISPQFEIVSTDAQSSTDCAVPDFALGDLPFGDLPFGDLPLSDLPLGDLPLCERAEGDLPLSERTEGGLPSGERADEGDSLPGRGGGGGTQCCRAGRGEVGRGRRGGLGEVGRGRLRGFDLPSRSRGNSSIGGGLSLGEV